MLEEKFMTKEIFDIVDENDQIISQAARDQVHGNPSLIHRVIHILVFNSQNELYLQKRNMNKDVQPGKWDTSVGGHVDKGESYRDAAVREMEEELSIKGPDLKYLYKYRLRNDFESEYISSYHCLWDGAIKTNVHEIEEGRFWRLDEIAQKANSGIFTPNFLDEIGRYHKILQKIKDGKDVSPEEAKGLTA